jgi:hypothetical protein
MECTQHKERSCLNCRHVLDRDTDWECGHPQVDSWAYEELDCPVETIWDNPQEFAIHCAANCPGYEFFDWDEADKQDSLAEKFIESQLPTEEELQSWRELESRDWIPGAD